MKPKQSFDIDGVILINNHIIGLRPHINDIIITGRSFEEEKETLWNLYERGIYNKVYFNSVLFKDKTRMTSGEHKGRTLLKLIESGIDISVHYDDDEIQIAEIQKFVAIPIIHISHNLTNKENIRRL